MKVLHIITGLNVGGAENMLAKLIEEASDRPQEVAVLSLLPPGPLATRIENQGVEIHTLGMRRGLAGPVAMTKLVKIVRQIAPDVIQGWMYHGNLAASVARFSAGRNTPLIWNIRHSIPDLAKESLQTRLILRLSAAISAGTDAIVYNAQVSRRQHEELGYSARKGMVIPNGFDTEKYAPRDGARDLAKQLFGFTDGTLRVGCVARFHPMKGQANLVEAVACARNAGCDAHLLLVGHGLEDPGGGLGDLIAQSLPPQRISTCGARFDVADWLSGLDVLVVPSVWGEAFPNVIGEALSCGVPVIATDVGDSALIVGENGLIVPPGDVDAKARAIVKLGELAVEDRVAMGLAGRERIRLDYPMVKIARKYAELYRSCLDAGDPHIAPEAPSTAHRHSAR